MYGYVGVLDAGGQNLELYVSLKSRNALVEIQAELANLNLYTSAQWNSSIRSPLM